VRTGNLGTADERGRVLVYDIRAAAAEGHLAPPLAAELPLYQPDGSGGAVEAVSAVAFHPFLPVIATGSGSRRFPAEAGDEAGGATGGVVGAEREGGCGVNEVTLHKLAAVAGPEPTAATGDA